MTLAEINTMLNGITGFSGKVAYSLFPVGQAPALPFICYFESGSNNFGADNIVYHPVSRVTVELYERQRSQADEGLIEAAFSAAEIYWEKSIEWLDDEKCYQTIYEIEV